jgi:cytosine deaminase
MKSCFLSLWLAFLFLLPSSACVQHKLPSYPGLEGIEQRIEAYVADPKYPDDPYILVTLREAMAGRREGNGGVGACLVLESTGEIVESGHNRQYAPYFRSDLHAEMDLLNRFEDRRKAQRIVNGKTENPRRVEGLVLYSSVEPCPMCLTRIINAGIRKTFYAVADPPGGMCDKIGSLPSFWKDVAKGRIYEPAACSPELKDLALRLFGHYANRNIKGNK